MAAITMKSKTQQHHNGVCLTVVPVVAVPVVLVSVVVVVVLGPVGFPA
jgi:hypothetical protein